MKRILSTALAIVLFVGASQAQDSARMKGHHGRKPGGDIYKELNLTEDQKAKLKSIRDAERTEMQSLKGDDKSESNREARKAVHEKYKTQIEAVLTPAQKEQIKNKQADWKEKGKGGKMDGFGKDRGDRKDRMKEFGKELNLSSDQQAKLKSINEDFKAKAQALRSNSTLSKEQQKEEFKKLVEAHKSNLKAVLTQEQLAKMEAARKNHKKNKDKNL